MFEKNHSENMIVHIFADLPKSVILFEEGVRWSQEGVKSFQEVFRKLSDGVRKAADGVSNL